MNIELFNPDFIIDCKEFNDPAMVYKIMRQHEIKRAYVYGMIWSPTLLTHDFIKVGMSCPDLGHEREYQVGERVVRQLAWVPGWITPHVYSSHGSEFWHGINHHLIPNNKLPAYFNKNMLKVGVWDISARTSLVDFFSEDEEHYMSRRAEGSLAAQYKKHFQGKLPPLNIQDPSKNKEYSGSRVSKITYFNLFSEEEIDNNSDTGYNQLD